MYYTTFNALYYFLLNDIVLLSVITSMCVSIKVISKYHQWSHIYIYIYILDLHMAPYGACEVEQSKVRSSAVAPNEREVSQN